MLGEAHSLDVYSTQIEPLGMSSDEKENTALDHNQGGLRRSLNGRHIAMIAIASGIGTGLFVSPELLW
jgi:amino acid permease